MDNSTNQAENFALQIEMRNELRQLLEKQEAVLKKLENQVTIVEDHTPSRKDNEEQKEEEESSRSFSIEDGGSSSKATTPSLQVSNNETPQQD